MQFRYDLFQKTVEEQCVLVVDANSKSHAEELAREQVEDEHLDIVRVMVIGWGQPIKDDAVLAEFRKAGPCEWCGLKCSRRDPHHIFARGMGGGRRLDLRTNLVGLCRPCHDRAHDGEIGKEALVVIVAKREQMKPSDIVDAITWSRNGKERINHGKF